MTSGDLIVPFMLGLVGSLHCVQMCGPIVLACGVMPESRGQASRLWALAAYNGGRIATYSALGAVAGAAGTGLNLVGRLGGIRNTAALTAGAILLAWGLVTLAGARFQLFRTWSLPAGLGRLLRGASIRNRLALGAALGFLPCGLVYGALLKALESAGPVPGALTMAAFGAGTAGPLYALGAFSAVLGRRLGRHAMVLSGASLAFTGAFLVWRGLQAPAACCH